MRIDIITIFPEFFHGILSHSILKRAIDKKQVEFHVHNLRDYASNKYKSIDDYPYGGGAGMVMMIEPISKIITELSDQRQYDDIIYLTPDGELLDQSMANRISMKTNLLLLCGHYKGIDERVREKYVTREISIGNYVLSGGELAAAVLSDSIVRLLPGVLGDETSALSDSFQNNLLAPPVYTRPREFEGMKVPEILLSGDDNKIQEWRNEKAVERTKTKRPELLDEI